MQGKERVIYGFGLVVVGSFTEQTDRLGASARPLMLLGK